MLHPHPPVRSWTAGGFDQAIKLVYDSYHALTHGEPPDFEGYRAAANASLDAGCVVVGQERAWMLREAKREAARMDANWRTPHNARYPTLFRPDGDPGPGYLAKVTDWSRGKATFRWLRDRRARAAYGQPNTLLPATIAVSSADLLNVSAYRPGDFRRFFKDPRTRAEYLQWAPMLIAAEEFHAGKLQLNVPSNQMGKR